MRHPDPALEDGRVGLRPITPEDVPAIAAACQDPAIPRWIPVPSPYSEKDAAEWVIKIPERMSQGLGMNLAVTESGDPTMLGAIGLDLEAGGEPVGEFGYWIARSARRRGLASSGLRLFARWALEDLGLKRVHLITHPDNAASQGVAEKAGFTAEGILRSWREVKGERIDAIMYSLVPTDL